MMAQALIKYETIDSNQIDDIMEGKEPRPPAGWSDDGDIDRTPPKKARQRNRRNEGKIGGPASSH